MCNIIIVLSEECKDKLQTINCKMKIVVLNNFSKLISGEKRENNKTVLFLGFLTKLKGCYDIPQIISIVSKEIPDVMFVLAGSGETEELQALCREKKIENNVVFPGWVTGEEKDDLLRHADLFLLPSYTEAMPMSILEAMGYGLPIISTNVGGIPTLVDNGVNGFLFDPGDYNGMAEKIKFLLLNDNIRKKQGDKSKNIAESVFSYDAHIDGLLRIYDQVLNEKN